jgi:hypothetical protein
MLAVIQEVDVVIAYIVIAVIDEQMGEEDQHHLIVSVEIVALNLLDEQ